MRLLKPIASHATKYQLVCSLIYITVSTLRHFRTIFCRMRLLDKGFHFIPLCFDCSLCELKSNFSLSKNYATLGPHQEHSLIQIADCIFHLIRRCGFVEASWESTIVNARQERLSLLVNSSGDAVDCGYNAPFEISPKR